MMNPEIKAKWLEALRSGEYKQGRYALVDVRSDGRRHCCLGVLCDLAAKEGVTRQANTATGHGFEDEGSVEDAVLPFVVGDWAGLGSRNPMAGGAALAAKNDAGIPFTEIADLIERYL